jgi:Tol biopolymer transport system component
MGDLTMKRRLLILGLAVVFGLGSQALAAKGGGGKGGGGGGEGEGPTAAETNPAIVFLDDVDGGLFLTTSDGSVRTRLTTNRTSRDLGAAWSPDFKPESPGHQGEIAFFRQPDPARIWGDIYVVPSDASGPPVRIRSFTDFSVPPPEGQSSISLSWSPDGRRIIYASEGAVWALTVASGAVERLFGRGGYYVDTPAFSPDLDEEAIGYQGEIAFTSADELPGGVFSGSDTFLCPVAIDGAGNLTVHSELTVNLSQSPGVIEEHPVWSADGRYLVFSRRLDGADIGADGRGISVIDVMTRVQLDVIDTYHAQIRPTWSPNGFWVGYSDARLVRGKFTADVFFVSPWDSSPPANVTKTDSSRAVEYFPAWNPAWDPNGPGGFLPNP